MRSYYGRLFDREINNKLEKWKISNSHLIEALKLLTRTNDKGNYFLLDYEALETRQLGAVYEKLLQYRLETIEVKDSNNKIRKVIKELPKPKERKDTGSVYTPQLIVDFMVKISLEPILKNISDKYPDKLEQEKKILELKILDPAIGSGHFLVGIINYLGKKLCDLKFGEDYGFDQLNEKKREVLRRCIYGVDINQLAVDLAMLTLWLETAYSEKPLSILSNLLKCGNSLISSELNTIFSTQTTLSEHDGKIPLGTGKKKLRKMIKEYLEIEMLPDDTREAVKFKMDKVSKMDKRNSDKTALKNILNMKIAKEFGVDVPPLGDLTAKFGNQSIEYYGADWAEDFEKLIDRIKINISNSNSKFYWVCPLIEESEELDLKAATLRYQHLDKIFKNKVLLMHGQLNEKEKEQIMYKFINEDYRILVATTVIEVGIDIKSATTIIIEHAERFGLAQLHQLRGRVGRSNLDSFCILLHKEIIGDNAKKRINKMIETNDGFTIAEEDLKIRGAGEILGKKQSGLPSFKIAELSFDSDLLEDVREYVEKISKNNLKLENKEGEKLRSLLYLYERDAAIKTLLAG